MKSYTEDHITMALEALGNGVKMSKVLEDYGVPRSTLRGRIEGRSSHQKSAQIQQKIAPIQERRLTDWILVQESLGTSPTHQQIREIGERILGLQGGDPSLGKRWINKFLRRNPVIRTKRQYRIDSARVSGASINLIKGWFQKLELPDIKAIKPQNRYNMDEAGIMEGQGLNGLVVGSSNQRFIQKKQPGSKVWTSFIECISATGKALDPLVIYKGKSVQQQWFPVDLAPYAKWSFTATENGWTTNSTALEWLKKVFIPSTTPSDPNEARLLILDGHGSHETTEFMQLCFENNIYLLFLPPHTSHVLQPLDLAVFSSLKNAYRQHLNKLSLLTDSTPIGKRNFLSCYYSARLEALTIQNIKSGWKASGLWPKNMAKPLMSRLLIENSNKRVIEEIPSSDHDPEFQWYIESSFIPWKTPQGSKDIRSYAEYMTREEEVDLPTRRLLFRKISKGFDAKDYNIIQAELRIQQLEHRIEQLAPRKRRKVKTSPNSKFAGIRAIREAQIAVGDRLIIENDSDTILESDS